MNLQRVMKVSSWFRSSLPVVVVDDGYCSTTSCKTTMKVLHGDYTVCESMLVWQLPLQTQYSFLYANLSRTLFC